MIHNAKHVYQHIMKSITVKGIQGLYPAYSWYNNVYITLRITALSENRAFVIDGICLTWLGLELVYGMDHLHLYTILAFLSAVGLKQAQRLYISLIQSKF